MYSRVVKSKKVAKPTRTFTLCPQGNLDYFVTPTGTLFKRDLYRHVPYTETYPTLAFASKTDALWRRWTQSTLLFCHSFCTFLPISPPEYRLDASYHTIESIGIPRCTEKVEKIPPGLVGHPLLLLRLALFILWAPYTYTVTLHLLRSPQSTLFRHL